MRFHESKLAVLCLGLAFSSSGFAATALKCDQGTTTILAIGDKDSNQVRFVDGQVSFKIPGSGSVQILQRFTGEVSSITEVFEPSKAAFVYTIKMKEGSAAVWENNRKELDTITVTKYMRSPSVLLLTAKDGSPAWSADSCTVDGIIVPDRY